ncbi:MAG: OmpA family protein [Bacteroidales bacterium]|nr:OmpA family protein [Bacteroidales bacterium]
MKKSLLFLGTCACMLFAANSASAQDEVVVEEVSVVDVVDVPCHTYYYSDRHSNWFIQLGAGIDVFMGEHYYNKGSDTHPITASYNFAFGKWMSPYLGWRLSFQGGAIHFKNGNFNKYNYVSGNFDLMWDMFNSFKVNPKRVFSVIPFVGLGGTFAWDYKGENYNVEYDGGGLRKNQWMLPVSAGLMLRFRCSDVVDIFAEGRAQFYGDSFNHTVVGDCVDVNFTCMGGLIFNIGGSGFKSYNPCDYVGYINSLNNQVNDLRGELATTAAALAVAEAQLPCPEVAPQQPATAAAPLLATVRFKINSAVIQPYEEVNVYNVARWMKTNPDQNVTISGYADKDTGTSEYNMDLSKRRAEAVRDQLVNKYGINPDRLSIQAEGSNVQPYDVNNWNRIVIFTD